MSGVKIKPWMKVSHENSFTIYGEDLLCIKEMSSFTAQFYETTLIKLDEAFLFFFLPLIDTLRLFVIRIFTSGRPWKADTNHMHHIITKKFNLNIALFSQYILTLFLILLVVYTDINNLFLIFIATVIYFVCFFKLRKN